MFKFLSCIMAITLVIAMVVVGVASHYKVAEDDYNLRQDLALHATTKLEGRYKVSENVIWEFKGDVLLEFADDKLVCVRKFFVERDGIVTLKPVYDLIGRAMSDGEVSIRLHKIGMGLVYETQPSAVVFQEI